MSTRAILTNLAVKEFQCKADELRDDLPIGQLGLDSLALIEFLFRIEEVFGVRIENEQVEDSMTLVDLVGLVDSLQGATA
jgi:acyl carrier protein